MSDIYPTGQVDPFIRTALDRAEVVRDIYAQVANVHHAEGWLPLSIVCPAARSARPLRLTGTARPSRSFAGPTT